MALPSQRPLRPARPGPSQARRQRPHARHPRPAPPDAPRRPAHARLLHADRHCRRHGPDLGRPGRGRRGCRDLRDRPAWYRTHNGHPGHGEDRYPAFRSGQRLCRRRRGREPVHALPGQAHDAAHIPPPCQRRHARRRGRDTPERPGLDDPPPAFAERQGRRGHLPHRHRPQPAARLQTSPAPTWPPAFSRCSTTRRPCTGMWPSPTDSTNVTQKGERP
jgi:hypothetical protein